MLTETARVVAIDNDGLWVETKKQSSCAQCAAKYGCGQKLLTEHLGEDLTCIKAFFRERSISKPWLVGEQVVIGVSERAFLLASFIAYLLPLAALIAASVLASQLFQAQWAVALSAFAGLMFGGALAWLFSLRRAGSEVFNAVVVGPANSPHASNAVELQS